ncbi:glycosyltransferase family 2 protein [Candidatus Dojkabacteria bacterium]|uniref:Glycosyltransferase family 2 protein n=1 Tax=Candidatus Dojkabacteria bacterium TaxID=2099670 RepID=A0A955L1I2_9BACT|nr:glycosyltransferase family 2 protein [Candidatus Dojkabacteria bacterium]
MEGGPNKSNLDIFLEKISPLLGYFLIFFPFVMSFINVKVTVIYLAAIYVYFVYKSAATAIQFMIALNRIRTANQINWAKLLKGLGNIDEELQVLEQDLKEVKSFRWEDYRQQTKQMYSNLRRADEIMAENAYLPNLLQQFLFNRLKRKTLNFLHQEISVLKELQGKDIIKPSELQHIVIVPHVKEPESILRDTIDHLKDQTFNTKQINIVLAAEAADPNGVSVSEKLKEEYKDVFNNIWITNHVLQADEIVGKSANMNWAGREVYQKVKDMGWDLKKTTVTSCDADSKLDPQYFAYLTYKYITTEFGEYKYYTSALIFYNNIWRLPFYARVKNSSHTIFNTANLVRSDKLVPFSTYTTSFWVLEQIGFWDPWVTPEDYHLFFKAIFKFNDKVSAVPLFLKTLSDAAEGEGHWATIKNNYLQSRRWAWGISDDGWVIKNFLKNFSRSSIRSKYITLHMLFDHIMGLSIAFLVLLGGVLPGFLNPDFNKDTAGALFPIVTGQFVQITIFFLIVTIIFDFYLRPTPKDMPWWKNITRVLEWVVQPIAGFILTAIPGLEAQTRLVFGRYLEYYVTKKKGDGEEEGKS